MQAHSFKAKSRLIISKEVQSQIMFLHNKIGDIEWSGLLFYSIVSGDISEPETLVLRANKIYLMDIGVGTYTEFTPDESIIDFYDKYPESVNQKWGMIHTHHNMATFFSGTDTDELVSNAGSHNFYLSLIVNHKSDFCAKIGIVAEVELETKNKFVFSHGLSFKNLVNNEKVETKKEKQLLTIDCVIQFEQDEFEVSRYDSIKKAKQEAAAKRVYPTYPSYRHGSFNEVDFSKGSKIKHHGQTSIYISKSKNEIDGFLADLWSMSANNKKNLETVLEEINEEYSKNKDQFEAVYFDGVEYALDETYYKNFSTYLDPEHEDKFFRQCILAMDNFRMRGYPLHDKMIEFMDFRISEEADDFEPEYVAGSGKKDSGKGKKSHSFGIDYAIEVGNKALDKFKKKGGGK